jgi:hypothetical protein
VWTSKGKAGLMVGAGGQEYGLYLSALTNEDVNGLGTLMQKLVTYECLRLCRSMRAWKEAETPQDPMILLISSLDEGSGALIRGGQLV